ncbi:hypothetical protein JHK87_042656 [Glycine soja]|nr:hypothetical protein JHK87_042656 [Glycine soja]
MPIGCKMKSNMVSEQVLTLGPRLHFRCDEYPPFVVHAPSPISAGREGGVLGNTQVPHRLPQSLDRDRTVIRVKEGIYKENVVIQSYKINIMMLGDGSDVTVITGNRSVGDGCTTFNSATLAVSGEGFLARDIAFNNSAWPEKQQAVALRVNADLTAFYRCAIHGYQDTLFVHSFRQFYRECDIYGTIDFIFGNAAVVLQGCNIVSKKPLPGQYTVITAQSRDSPNENTGISIQYCSIKANFDDSSVKSYLGRPWRIHSRTVYLESYIDDFIDPKGWTKWSNEQGLDTLYYGEFDNYGPGSSTDNRVQWSGYHAMDHDDAFNFTVLEFINDGHDWLESTFVPGHSLSLILTFLGVASASLIHCGAAEMRKPKNPPSPSSNSTTPITAGRMSSAFGAEVEPDSVRVQTHGRGRR